MQRLLFHCVFLVCAIGVVAWMLRADPPAATGAAAASPGPADPTHAADAGFSGDETVIERDASGQFRLTARVNGEDAEFLVDTGADVVALTPAEAERLGLPAAPDDFRPIMRTASGVGNGAHVTLDRIELGDAEFRDVGAVVVEGLEVNLLGQSVLRRLGKVELQGDRMVVAHR